MTIYWIISTEDEIAVRDAVGKLSPKQQRAVWLYFRDGLKQDEIAKDMGISQQNVGKLLSRALSALKNILSEQGVKTPSRLSYNYEGAKPPHLKHFKQSDTPNR